MSGSVVAVAVEEEEVCLAVVVLEDGRRFRLTMLVRPGTAGEGARVGVVTAGEGRQSWRNGRSRR